MRFLWLDTETTGLEITDSAAFEVAMILVDNGKFFCDRCFFLNPLSETIKYHEEAGKVHGYSEEDIKCLPPESEQVPKIADFLEKARELWKTDGSQTEKLILAGYNVGFDKKHLNALLERNGYKWEDYFSDIEADVFVQVKKAGMQKALPYLPDRKLGTVAKHLGVTLDNAHDALADIKATRQVAAKLHQLGVSLV
jgi:DNA polymerase III epsilon subunit-like protein